MKTIQIEFDYWIPANVTVNADGTISDTTDVYSFDNHDTFFLRSFTGLGMPPIEYITQRGPYQNGETALDYRLRPRTIQYVHRKNSCDRETYWDNRSSLIDALRPNRQLLNTFNPARLRKVLPDGSYRDINVFIDSGPAFLPRGTDWQEFSFDETLRFIAHDPTFYNPAQVELEWTLATLNQLVFPITFPIVFGSSALADTLNVTYTGTWESFPTIVITGPLNEPRIANNTIGEEIQLEYNVSAGESVTITLEYGNKTVVNNSGTNLIGTVTSTSDLATFRIAPDPEAPNGINELFVSGSGALPAQTSVTMSYNTRYIGI